MTRTSAIFSIAVAIAIIGVALVAAGTRDTGTEVAVAPTPAASVLGVRATPTPVPQAVPAEAFPAPLPGGPAVAPVPTVAPRPAVLPTPAVVVTPRPSPTPIVVGPNPTPAPNRPDSIQRPDIDCAKASQARFCTGEQKLTIKNGKAGQTSTTQGAQDPVTMSISSQRLKEDAQTPATGDEAAFAKIHVEAVNNSGKTYFSDGDVVLEVLRDGQLRQYKASLGITELSANGGTISADFVIPLDDASWAWHAEIYFVE